MVDPKDGNREKFIINEGYAAEEAADSGRQVYYKRSSTVFRKKSVIPLVFGGLGLAVLVVILVNAGDDGNGTDTTPAVTVTTPPDTTSAPDTTAGS